MQKKTLPKPKSETFRPQIVHLPVLTWQRRIFRRLVKTLAQRLVWLFIRVKITGQENFPERGAALMVSNHLGDADVILGIALSPRPLELIAKAELYDFPILGWILEQYGVIWIHRGQPDRPALRAALQALEQKRLVCIAPEGRESLSGNLEEGTRGAAYLALKSQVAVIPITYTHTENWRVIHNLKHLKKTDITITIGNAFQIKTNLAKKHQLDTGTQEIMQRLAAQLPQNYRGEYLTKEPTDDCQ